MSDFFRHPLTDSNRRYTPPVTARRLLTRAGGTALLVALLFLPNLSLADAKKPAKPTAKAPPVLTVPSTQDAASSAAQAARLAADSADQASDGSGATARVPRHRQRRGTRPDPGGRTRAAG